MDFEPFQSDEDEDVQSFISEKKKKDGSVKKKAKPGQLFRSSEKREKNAYNDIHSPSNLKHKHVHGLVGPADYIYDQGSPPSEISVTTNNPLPVQPVPNPVIPAPSPQQIVNQPHGWVTNQEQPIAQTQQFQQPASPLPMPTLKQQPLLQQQPVAVGNFQPNFPPVTTISTKIERPHSSAALLQDRQSPQTPTPFKQPQLTPQKMTLLAQAMSSNQFQPGSSPFQGPINAYQTHQRNQSYSRAMSAPLLSKAPDIHGFQANFETALEINTTPYKEFPVSPIREVVTPTSEILATPPGTPKAQLTNEELWSQQHVSQVQDSPSGATWANFSTSSSPQDQDIASDNDELLSRRKSHGAESLGESIPDSVSSIEDEGDDVWRINDEQRDYYTNQFQKIQPNIHDVIKGPQARDFFLKSSLPNETLSKIWHLSDLDKDSGLNLDEFCIAMHLVVAVRHGVELPTVLPPTLLPQEEADPFDITASMSSQEELYKSREMIVEKTDKSTEWAADFDGDDGVTRTERLSSSEMHSPTVDTVQTKAQPTSSDDTTIPMESRAQPVSTQQPSSPPLQRMNKNISASASSVNQIQEAMDKVGILNATPTSPKLRHNSTPSLKDAEGSSGTAIARPRASITKNVNLMDAQPWQLLPPPSSKLKQTVKKQLTLDGDMSSNVSLSSVGSNDPLVTIDRSSEIIPGVRPLPGDDSDGEGGKLTVRPMYYINKNLSKEKSRSIDSLRSDISESSEFSWRRPSTRRESRPRSYTGSSTNEAIPSSTEEQTKEFEIPPIPPPRNKGHARASSLDLNQLFASKALHPKSDFKIQNQNLSDAESKTIPPQKPPRTSVYGKLNQPQSSGDTVPPTTEKFIRPRPHPKDPNTNTHRRSFSLDSDLIVGPPRKPTDGLVARTEATQKIMSDEHLDRDPAMKEPHIVRFATKPDVVINQPKSPIERQMRKNELQSRIRHLRTENTTLSTLLSQLDIEWKETSEDRISLDVRLQKLRQQELE